MWRKKIKITDGIPDAYQAYIDAPIHPRPGFDWTRVPESTMDLIMPHQVEAIKTVGEHGGRSVIAMSPGTGKTLVGSLSTLYYKDGLHLIIVPAGKVSDWVGEYLQWTGLPITPIPTAKSPLESRTVVCSYDIAKENAAILATKWDLIVVDECHMLKGRSQRSKVIIPKLIHKAKGVVMLSGTPQESNPAELYNCLNAINRKVFSNRRVFTERYADGHYNFHGAWEERGAKNLDELALILARCMYRVTGDVLNLAPPVRKIIRLTPTGEDRKRLEALAEMREGLAEDARGASKADAREITMRQKALANLTWTESGVIKARVGLAACEEIIRTHGEQGVIFFTHHIAVAESLAASLRDIGYSPLLITGELSKEKRQVLVDRLADMDDMEARIGVLTIDSCGTGFNMSPGISVSVYVEMPHTPGKAEQGEGRVQRKGTVNPVYSYWFVLEGSKDDEHIRKIQERRRVNGVVVDGIDDNKFTFDL